MKDRIQVAEVLLAQAVEDLRAAESAAKQSARLHANEVAQRQRAVESAESNLADARRGIRRCGDCGAPTGQCECN